MELKDYFEQYNIGFSLIEDCTDNCLFVYDLDNDFLIMSNSVMDRFNLSDYRFDSTTKKFKKIISKKDYKKIIDDIKILSDGGKTVHNAEIRLIDGVNEGVWISVKGRIYDNDDEHKVLAGCIYELSRKNKYDKITGLCCEEMLKEEYSWLKLTNNKYGCLMLIGIDNFKEINEKYSNDAGDTILSQLAVIIKKYCDDEIKIYRYHGDEFAVMFKGEKKDYANEAKKLYKKIRRKVDKSIAEKGYQFFYTISAGVVEFDAVQDVYSEVSRKARYSLHRAKIEGKNTFVNYSEEEYLSYIRKIDIQEELRKNIDNGFEGFMVYYQPIMNPSKGKLNGAEALIRWNSKKYGFMSPVEFVPLLEESSLIIPLGKWIIEKAIKQCMEWVKAYPDFVMNINLSFVQIIKSDILKDAMELLDKYGINHKNIVFEVTESGELENNSSVKNVLDEFNNKSFRLAIDDFGTGYSNLRYIRDMMFGIIKIDRLFVKDINKCDENYTLVKYVTEMAHNFNLKVCVEGVETQEEYEKIMTLHPDCIQGYYYGRPVDAEKFDDKYISECYI